MASLQACLRDTTTWRVHIKEECWTRYSGMYYVRRMSRRCWRMNAPAALAASPALAPSCVRGDARVLGLQLLGLEKIGRLETSLPFSVHAHDTLTPRSAVTVTVAPSQESYPDFDNDDQVHISKGMKSQRPPTFCSFSLFSYMARHFLAANLQISQRCATGIAIVPYFLSCTAHVTTCPAPNAHPYPLDSLHLPTQPT